MPQLVDPVVVVAVAVLHHRAIAELLHKVLVSVEAVWPQVEVEVRPRVVEVRPKVEVEVLPQGDVQPQVEVEVQPQEVVEDDLEELVEADP